MEDQKETKKSFYGQELQEIKEQLKDIKKLMIDHSKNTNDQLRDLIKRIEAMDRFLFKLNKKLDLFKNQTTSTNDLLLLLVEFNEFKEGLSVLYKGIHGTSTNIKTEFGIYSEE